MKRTKHQRTEKLIACW